MNVVKYCIIVSFRLETFSLNVAVLNVVHYLISV